MHSTSVRIDGSTHDELKRFYKYHFIGENPPDIELVPISRTVGSDQIVDEMLFKFTHTTEIDYMLPGIKPTGRKVAVPLVAIVRFEDVDLKPSGALNLYLQLRKRTLQDEPRRASLGNPVFERKR